MAAQYDFKAGLDLSSLSSVTQAQLMQAITQIAPLTNIGGIVVSATEPDVTNNPRFSRYLWIDTSGGAGNYIIKYYDQVSAWVAGTVSDGAISNADAIVDGILTISKMKGDEGLSGEVARVNAGRTALEYVAPPDLFSVGDIPVNTLEATIGDNDKFLRVSSGVASWQSYDPAEDISNLNPSQIASATPRTFLMADEATGVPKFTNWPLRHLSLLNATDYLNLNKLNPTGLTDGAMLRIAGSNWTAANPTINVFGALSEYYQDAASTLNVSATTSGDIVTATTLSAAPKIWKVVLVCVGNDASAGYIIGDEIDLSQVGATGVAFGTSCAYFDAADNKIKVSHDVLNRIRKKTDASSVTFTATNFKLRARYII